MLVTSLDAGAPFSEQCNTTLVNAHGCGLIASREMPLGMRVRLEIVSAKRHTKARVGEVVSLGGDPETWLVGLELDVPGNFWGIDYAPSDWKIEESPSPAAGQRLGPELGASDPAGSRRWRLADISEGACYLETAVPFPKGSPVLVSVWASETEYLLEGRVRVSYPETGMGVEFTGVPVDDRRMRVADLIGRLKSNREVPIIFVERNEQQSRADEGKKDEGKKGDRKDDQHEAQNDKLPDPLLQLIREGPSLTTEQFVNDLRAQRLGKRRDPRVDLAVPVLLTGTDINGRPLDQRVMTVNISRRGALLEGVHGLLKPGDQIYLSRLRRREQFRVAWVGGNGTPKAGQIGVAAVDPNTTFWSELLETSVESGLEAAGMPGNRSEMGG
ncbi:MAG: PilZ domain-containing protein [Terriglobales bacterium]